MGPLLGSGDNLLWSKIVGHLLQERSELDSVLKKHVITELNSGQEGQMKSSLILLVTKSVTTIDCPFRTHSGIRSNCGVAENTVAETQPPPREAGGESPGSCGRNPVWARRCSDLGSPEASDL